MPILINLGFILTAFLFLSRPAYGYLDPGSGSFIFQVLVGAVLGGLVTIKLYFGKIKNFFLKKNRTAEAQKNGKSRNQQD